MTPVSREKFFAYVGPRDIVLRTERDAVYWETRNRTVVGVSTPGYLGDSPKTWKLSDDALRTINAQLAPRSA